MNVSIEKIRFICNNLLLNPKHSDRQLARMASSSHKTTGKIRRLLSSTDIDTVEKLKQYSNAELENKLGICKRNKTKARTIIFEQLNDEMKLPDMTIRLFHTERKAENPNFMSYSDLAKGYKRWRQKQRLSMRQIFKAGEQVLVDFCGRTVPVYNSLTGETRQVQVFVGVLGASSYIFSYAVDSQKSEDWQKCHIEMFKFFGGVPRQVVTDNLKSAVIVNNGKSLEINQSYASLAEHFNFAINPTRPRKPQDKGLAEVSVQIVQRGILAKLRHHKFFSLTELNDEIMRELKVVNNKTTHRFKVSRYDQFMKFDKPVLSPLPLHDYSVKSWLYKKRVNEFYLVNVNEVEYSVPFQFVHKQVDVAISGSLIELYYQRERIACHAIREKGSNPVIELQHMPKEHQAHFENSPDYLESWASNFGQSVDTNVLRAERRALCGLCE